MVIKTQRYFSPAGENRGIHLYLPDDYQESQERYPVIYMFDGHNLYFDSDATFGKCLGMKDFLDHWGKKFIVVGIACADDDIQRVHEYCPYHIQSRIYGDLNGRGDATVEWIVKELKPWIDKTYRTWPHREATAIAGYSMGGMMTLFTILRYNKVFSKAAVISPALLPAMEAFRQEIAKASVSADTRIFFSWGTAEESPEGVRQLEEAIRELEYRVQQKGVQTYLFRQEGGVHNESSWEHQLPVWMDYLWNQEVNTMNVIFISPHFPLHFYQFCDRLKRMGVNVLGIGDTPYDSISDNCKASLTEYYRVDSLEDYEQVYRAVAFYIHRYGRIDYIDSQNEYWLELEAKIRTDFNIPTGFHTADLDAVKHKSRMKEGYRRAGVKTARFHLVDDWDGCIGFIREVGYPVVVKPDNGVGASNTEKLKSDEDLAAFFASKPNVQFIMEEFVPGHVETFDGITDRDGNILFCAGQVLVQTPMDMLHGSGENVSYSQNVQAMDLMDIGSRVVAAFCPRNRFFHFEFFRLDEDKEGLGRKGEILGLEVNMRAPGGYIPDKMNYTYDVDVYQIWAESLIFNENRSFPDYSFKRHVTHVGRGGRVEYLHAADEVRDRYWDRILMENRPPEAISGTMGSFIYLIWADSLDELNEQADFILRHADGQSWIQAKGSE